MATKSQKDRSEKAGTTVTQIRKKGLAAMYLLKRSVVPMPRKSQH